MQLDATLQHTKERYRVLSTDERDEQEDNLGMCRYLLQGRIRQTGLSPQLASELRFIELCLKALAEVSAE